MALGLEPAQDSPQVFDDVLALSGRAQPVPELLRQASGIARRVLTFDQVRFVLPSPDGAPALSFTADAGGDLAQVTGDGLLDAMPVSEPRLLEVVPGAAAGFSHGVVVPLPVSDDAAGALTVLSRTAHAYTAADVERVARFARCLGYVLRHQALLRQARQWAAERERWIEMEHSVELLRTIGDVLDIRTVFARVSDIVNRMLPHDALTMAFTDRDRHFVRQAKAPADFPDPPAMTTTAPLPDEVVIGDLSTEPLPAIEPADAFAPTVEAGFRSLLSVRIPARERHVALTFWARRTRAYSAADLAAARRIADYIALSVSHEQLVEAERQAADAQARADRLEARVQVLTEELEARTQTRVVGASAEWRDVLKKATQVAETDTTVLITGESGTGKEVIARFIHRASARSRGPFVALNCAALPEQLLESELFGYERGAFTSAQQAKAGQIELASGGVLFLDEVTEMSLAAQAKFLRVLQEREFQRLGGTRVQKANIRVIAATNRDLRKAVERGDFREDLLYRLKVFDIRIPPLRERTADILPLSDVLLQDIARSFARPPAGLTRDARQVLFQYHWPGNVRELRNALERAAILCEGGLIGPEHLALEVVAKPPGGASTDLGTLERDTIAQVLRDCRWNRTRAAKRLGLTRTQLYLRLQKYGLTKPPDA